VALTVVEGAAHLAPAVLEHPVHLGVGGQKDCRERTTGELSRGIVGRVEGSVVIHVEKCLAMLLGTGKLSPFEGDGGPGDDGGGREEGDDELNDPRGLPDQVEGVQARETSPHDRPSDNEQHGSLEDLLCTSLEEGIAQFNQRSAFPRTHPEES
jgi:hypothetical protein